MLDKKIQDHLDLVMPPAKKELKFIKEHDWSIVSKLEKRESMYNLQSILNDRNISALIKLYSLAEEELGNPEVNKSIKLLLEFYYILEKRYNHVTRAFDWTEFDEADSNVEKRMEMEIAFQSGVLKELSSLKERLRKINFGEESDNLDVPIHSDKPIPFTMSNAIEERYPEVRAFINKKIEEGKNVKDRA
jgi:hypothetical protein